MGARRRYRKKPDQFVTAVQLNLEMSGFAYRKWGSEQHCKKGDWLVDNDGETYTVDREVFDRTYEKLSPGVYFKPAPIWAEVAEEAGAVETKEGLSHFGVGDYLVSNDESGTDAYCMEREKFEAMYELDE